MTSAERYTHGFHESVLQSHAWRTVENSAAYLIPHLRPGTKILDIGSGLGTITIDLAERVAPAEVVGIDSSETVLEHARGLAADNGVANVTFMRGDAYALDVDDGAFDLVHIHQVLQHVADPVAVLVEARRATAPGGVVGAREVDYGGTIWFPALPGLSRWKHVYDAVHRANGGDPDAGRSLKHWVRRAGFDRIETGASVWCFSDDGDRSWWGETWAQRSTESDFARTAIESGLADADDLREMAAAWRTWAQDPDGWMAMPHAEVIAHVGDAG